MKTSINAHGMKARILRLLLCLAILNFTFLYHKAQGQSIFNKNMAISQASMLVSSNSGDWVMSTIDVECLGAFSLDESNVLRSVNNLNFSLDAASLTSINSSLDQLVRNTIKASQHAKILFTLDSASILPSSINTYVIKTNGQLTVGGKQQPTKIELTARVNPDKTVNLTGMLKFKLSDFELERPNNASGNLKVKNDVSLILNLAYQNEQPAIVLTKN